MCKTDTTQTKRTITLTNRPPVTITEDLWPITAVAKYHDYDNQYEFQAFRQRKANIVVREHGEDGRKIVYGRFDFTSCYQNENGFLTRAGVLLAPDDDVVQAIHRVADTLRSQMGESGWESKTCKISALERECIADLPAVDVDIDHS